MNRVTATDDIEWHRLVSEITNDQDWWNHPVAERIGFQRFGMELRDEDLEQEGIHYRDFFIRDRNETRIATSGFSEIKNNNQEFQVTIDVWPFKQDEIMAVIVSDRYIIIDGEHPEKYEDNSVCTRKFTRRYVLPKGCVPHTIQCLYNKGKLTISLDKIETKEEPKVARVVPITMDNWMKTRSEPVEKKKEYENTTKDVRELPIIMETSISDSKNTSG